MSKRHILVVDDEPDIRNLVQEILEDEGFSVSVAENAIIARQLIKEGVVQGGMTPKTECCIRALAQGVAAAHIIDGRIPHSLLLDQTTPNFIPLFIFARILSSRSLSV